MYFYLAQNKIKCLLSETLLSYYENRGEGTNRPTYRKLHVLKSRPVTVGDYQFRMQLAELGSAGLILISDSYTHTSIPMYCVFVFSVLVCVSIALFRLVSREFIICIN